MDVAGATTLSIQDLNHFMQKTRKHVPRVATPRQEKEEKEDKNMLKKMAVEDVLTERVKGFN